MKPIFKTSNSGGEAITEVDTLVIDVSWLAQRHAHALGQRMYTEDGRMNGHVFGAFKDMKSIIFELSPRNIAFAYDRGYQWRLALLPSYKEKRRPSLPGALPSDVFTPAPDVERMFRCFPATHLSYEDSEADDMVAWATENHERSGAMVVYSKDKDLWQLISDDREVACMFPHKASPRAKSKRRWVREGGVEVDFGVGPRDLAKLKALAGDPSDNIKGIIGGRKPGKKEAVRAFAAHPSSAEFFDASVSNPKLHAPDFLVAALMEERDRLLLNFQVTCLPQAVARITGNPATVTQGDVGGVLGVLAEFECESLMGQAAPLFERLDSLSGN